MDVITTIEDGGVDLFLIKGIPYFFAKNNLVIPMRRDEESLYVAFAEENGLLAALELAKLYGLKLCPLQAEREIIINAINRFYGQIGTAEEVMDNLAGEDLSSVATEFEKGRDLLELTEDAPIIRLLNALFQQALKEKASDIHIEPFENALEVRMRIDGIMRKVLSPPKIIQDALVSRVKIMANLDIAENRLPQDGRIRLLIGGQDIDVRVSIVPNSSGERVVMRLLNRKHGLIGLGEMGIDPDDVERMQVLLTRTTGMILVTGPTGSGKTTTLYAALNRIYTEEKNIITIEDPVEYQLNGIGQIHVNPKAGLTFATGLRSILRQDPDVIMIGEIRDFDTAEMAIQASLTGHLVLSTLHTNDAPSAVTRLIDIGVEPFLVASSLVAVVAQRLVRVICAYCKESHETSDVERAYFPDSSSAVREPSVLYSGKGCQSCQGSGYSGRTGIYELLYVDNRTRQMISEKAGSQAIKDHATTKGMKTLYMDGLNKVARGVTTLQEVVRVTQRDYADIQL